MLKSIIMSAAILLAMFAGAENRIYQGNYATGIAKWTFNATNEIPDALLVFLATQILVDESAPRRRA